MKLKKLDLCNYDFKEFIKQVKPDTPYLAKIDDKWRCGKIHFCGIGARDNRDESTSWDIDLGSYQLQLGSKHDGLLDADFQEIYEIVDPELRKKKTKELLKSKTDEEIDGYLTEEESAELRAISFDNDGQYDDGYLSDDDEASVQRILAQSTKLAKASTIA